MMTLMVCSLRVIRIYLFYFFVLLVMKKIIEKIPHWKTIQWSNGGCVYRLLNWGTRWAALRPYFIRRSGQILRISNGVFRSFSKECVINPTSEKTFETDRKELTEWEYRIIIQKKYVESCRKKSKKADNQVPDYPVPWNGTGCSTVIIQFWGQAISLAPFFFETK